MPVEDSIKQQTGNIYEWLLKLLFILLPVVFSCYFYALVFLDFLIICYVTI